MKCRQLFEERSTHIVEFTNKASEIVDGIIEYSWQQVLACKYAVREGEITSQEGLLANAVKMEITPMEAIILYLQELGTVKADMIYWD